MAKFRLTQDADGRYIMPKPGEPRDCYMCERTHCGEGQNPHLIICRDCYQTRDRKLAWCLMLALGLVAAAVLMVAELFK